jgi:hypothetical protein
MNNPGLRCRLHTSGDAQAEHTKPQGFIAGCFPPDYTRIAVSFPWPTSRKQQEQAIISVE